jgi:hypothetical protein
MLRCTSLLAMYLAIAVTSGVIMSACCTNGLLHDQMRWAECVKVMQATRYNICEISLCIKMYSFVNL